MNTPTTDIKESSRKKVEVSPTPKRLHIGVVGRGHVGSRLAAQLADYCQLTSFDLKLDDSYPETEFRTCDFVMICVDTPPRDDGSVNIDNVEKAIEQVPCNNILIRSTVPPGTTDALAKKTGKTICFAPEYVGETAFVGSSWASFEQRDPFIILGGRPEHQRFFVDKLVTLYGPLVRLFQCSAAEAELVKYMENSYFATKVIFVNQFRDLAEGLGLDWHAVREGWLLDPRVERDHTAVFDGRRGFDGKCLPKDVFGILRVAEAANVSFDLLSAVREVNERYRANNVVADGR